MKISTVIEIAAEMDATIQARLVSSAYRLSRADHSVLALRGVSPKAVDRMLDPVVAAEGLQVCGVIYADVSQLASVLRHASAGTVVVGSTKEFRSECLSLGIRALGVEEALNLWDQTPSTEVATADLSAA